MDTATINGIATACSMLGITIFTWIIAGWAWAGLAFSVLIWIHTRVLVWIAHR